MALSPERRLAYDFLDLPTHVQKSIAAELGLSESGDERLPVSDQHIAWFRRAREKGKLDELREAIVERMPD